MHPAILSVVLTGVWQTRTMITLQNCRETEEELAGTEISGKKLGVIGLGAIGVLVANAATIWVWMYMDMIHIFLSMLHGTYPEA